MDYVNLGRSGLKVSRLCLGCMTYTIPGTSGHSWLLNEEDSRPFYKHALDLGINFFDTANIYSAGASEEVLGRAIRDLVPRDEVVIATKLYNPMRKDPNARGLSRKAVMTEIDASLKRLGTDYVDLYIIHRWDETTPIEETLEALTDVVKMGKARYIGASTMFAWQFSKALQLSERHGFARFISMQNHWNLLYREEEREMMGLCAAEGVGVTPWSPLARGRLARTTGDTSRAAGDQYAKTLYSATEAADNAVVERLREISGRKELPPAQVALAWLMQKKSVVSPVIGATKLQHLDDAAAALAVKLTAEEVAGLEEPYIPHALAGF